MTAWSHACKDSRSSRHERTCVTHDCVVTCRVGVNCKILNSVLLNGCNVGDGVHLQNSTVGPAVSIGSKAQLRDCQVGPGYAVPDSADHRDEALAAS